MGHWLVLAIPTLVGGWVADEVGVPSGYLFAGLLIGLARSLTVRDGLTLPEPAFSLGQAIAGVAIGALVSAAGLAALSHDWLSVALVGSATLALTIASGLWLAQIAPIDKLTASLGMIAGGASGIVAMASDLGGDERLVAFMQYQRVLIVTILTSLAAPLFLAGHLPDALAAEPLLGSPAAWALTVGAASFGALIGPRIRLPAPTLLGPLLLTAGLAVVGALGDTGVPPLASDLAFSLIGLRIGLGFDPQTLRAVARLVPPTTSIVLINLVVCFGLGVVLSLATGATLLDGYLATTPGGLYAVLPIAYGAGADTTFVLGVQTLRLLTMIIAAPMLVSRLHDFSRRTTAQ